MRFNAALTGSRLTEQELEQNRETADFFFSPANYTRLHLCKLAGATAGCPAEWMAGGEEYVVTFLGNDATTVATSYESNRPHEPGETIMTTLHNIMLSGSRQPGSVYAPIILWYRTGDYLTVVVPWKYVAHATGTYDVWALRIEMNTGTGSATIHKVRPMAGGRGRVWPTGVCLTIFDPPSPPSPPLTDPGHFLR